MKQSIRVLIALLALVLLQAVVLTRTSSAQGVQTGILTCRVAGGFGWILGSTRTMNCIYRPSNGQSEDYDGGLSRIGIDVGYLSPFSLMWAVFAPNYFSGPGALTGTYVGATVQGAALLGGGVNVLIGGFSHSISLQPISVESNVGLYLGGGFASMSLHQSDD
jgi:Protein of unknown function (DUF992)